MLTKNQSICLKGIFALMVLLCHIHANITLFTKIKIGSLFSCFGYLATGGFFFLSGYGLMYKYLNKNYEKHYIIIKKLLFHI